MSQTNCIKCQHCESKTQTISNTFTYTDQDQKTDNQIMKVSNNFHCTLKNINLNNLKVSLCNSFKAIPTLKELQTTIL